MTILLIMMVIFAGGAAAMIARNSDRTGLAIILRPIEKGRTKPAEANISRER